MSVCRGGATVVLNGPFCVKALQSLLYNNIEEPAG